MSEVLVRIMTAILLILVALWAPWWVLIIGGIGALFLFPFYVEFVVIAFMADVAFGTYLTTGIPLLTLGATILFIGAMILRRWLRFYEEDHAPLL